MTFRRRLAQYAKSTSPKTTASGSTKPKPTSKRAPTTTTTTTPTTATKPKSTSTTTTKSTSTPTTTSPSVSAAAPSIAAAARPRGFTHQRQVFPTALALARAPQCPPGLEPLRLPAAGVSASALEVLAADPVDPARPVIAVDLETTGLSGTVVAFIGCAAWHEDHHVVVEQFTLVEAQAERAFLRAFTDRLRTVMRDATQLLSFNGASFDLPRLRDRMRRLALPNPAEGRTHCDLVVPARRLFKGIFPNCRQATLERQLLNVHRRGDMAGAEVAEIFDRLQAAPDDDWVRDDLALAARHNRADVLGLLGLLQRLADTIAHPTSPDQARRAAAHHRRAGRLELAIATLDPHAASTVDAALALADLYRTAGRHEDAAARWAWVIERAPGHVAAHEALAKHLEHRRRRPAAALEVAAASAAPCPRRLARLRRKAGEIGAALLHKELDPL